MTQVVAYNNGSPLVDGQLVKTAVIDTATSDAELVAAATGKRIRVHSLYLINGHTAAQTVRFESSAGGTALSGQMIFAANGGLVLPWSDAGWFETVAGQALTIELAGATTVDGGLRYTLVD